MGMADGKYIDAQAGLARMANNEALFKKLLAKFETSVDMARFAQTIRDADWVAAGEIVHAAKGVAGNLSLTAFYEEAATLMEQLRGGNEPNPANVAAFEKLHGETVEAIRAYLA